MIVDQFHAAAAAAKNTYAIDETSRLLWRAHSDCLCRRQGPSAALLRAGNAILVRLIAKPRSSVAAVRP